MPRELLQGFSFGAGKARLSVPLVHCRLLLVSPEGVFIVTNCMLTLPGTLARVFLVTTDGFSFFGPEPSHLGSLARVMIRLYTQDPSCTLFCLVVRSPFHVPWLPPLASLVSRSTLSLEQTVWPQLVVA